jgi:hypothetical protein
MGKAVCPRCNVPWGADDDLRVGGVCRRCSSALLSVLESLGSPAAYVNRDLTVMTSNRLFKRRFGRFVLDTAGLRIGEAMKCQSAARHGRCGETSLCLHCGIRRLIDLARITGEHFSDIPLIVRDRSGSDQLLHFSFSKAEESILVMLKAGPGQVMQEQPR